MSIVANATDLFLRFYGQRVPYHRGKWRIFEALYPLVSPCWDSPRIVNREGSLFECDLRQHVDRIIYYLGYDSYETSFVKQTVKPGWVAMDIGANVGYYALLLSKLVGPSGRVDAFEPGLEAFSTMRRNIEINRAFHVYAHRVAISDHPGMASMWYPRDGNTACLKIEAGSEVGVTSLDNFVAEAEITRLDFIKVDIEGNEWRFLDGAEKVLQRFMPIILTEVNPSGLREAGGDAESYLSRLEGLGYEFRGFDGYHLVSLNRPINESEITGAINVVCTPSHRG